jgi:hypothetical protein
MRWLASRPRWLLAGALVLVILGRVLDSWVRGAAVMLAFVLLFATLMAFARRESPPPRSPH